MKRLSRGILAAMMAAAFGVGGTAAPAQAAAQAQIGKAITPEVGGAVVHSMAQFTRGRRSSKAAVSGCPWPGNRIACARRTAGTTRRMR